MRPDEHPLLDTYLEGSGSADASLAPLIGAGSSPVELEEIAKHAVGGVRTLLGAEAASVLLLDSDHTLRFVTVHGGEDSLARVRIRVGEGIAGWVAAERRPLAVADVHQDPRFASRFDQETGFVTRTVAAAPMWLGTRLIGVVEAINRADGGTFEDRDAKLLEEMGKHLAIAVVNAVTAAELHRRNGELEREVGERIRQVVLAKEEWLQTIDGIREPILMVGAGYLVRRANRAVSLRSSVSVTQLPGQRCYELMFERREPCEGCSLEPALGGEVVQRELTIGGESFEVFQSPVNPAPGEVGPFAVCTYRDVTAARAMEEQLRATERLAVVGGLAGGMAHEINNPLGFVDSNLASLESYVTDAIGVARRMVQRTSDEPAGTTPGADLEFIEETGLEMSQLIGECHEGIARVAQIVKELGVFSDDGVRPATPVQISKAMEHAANEEIADFPEAKITFEGPDELRVLGDRMQLVRAFRAVLRNAFQAGGPTRVQFFQLGAVVRVEIRDEGPGIPLEIRGHEFEPFVTSRRVGAGKGLGLGLSVAHTLVSSMGGRIGIEAAESRGTLASIELPTATVAGAETPHATS